jgi:L-ribulose-5-phosphate 3-epimerase
MHRALPLDWRWLWTAGGLLFRAGFARIAIMQGRLLPPRNGRFQCFPVERWREEFAKAAEAGLDAIEWIYDLQGAALNPLASCAGIAEIQALSKRHNLAVVSVCADYFIDRPFVAAGPAEFAELTSHLIWLISRCHLTGIERLVLPFVDASQIYTSTQTTAIVDMLRTVLPHAAEAGVEIHLETAFSPEDLIALLARLPHPFLKVNYDSGNSAALGYNVKQELAGYGSRIGSVHIKDRVRGGGTVPLGTGDADIPTLLAGLVAISYTGDFVLQVARGIDGEEIAWARHNIAYLHGQLERAKLAVYGVLPGGAAGG